MFKYKINNGWLFYGGYDISWGGINSKKLKDGGVILRDWIRATFSNYKSSGINITLSLCLSLFVSQDNFFRRRSTKPATRKDADRHRRRDQGREEPSTSWWRRHRSPQDLCESNLLSFNTKDLVFLWCHTPTDHFPKSMYHALDSTNIMYIWMPKELPSRNSAVRDLKLLYPSTPTKISHWFLIYIYNDVLPGIKKMIF